MALVLGLVAWLCLLFLVRPALRYHASAPLFFFDLAHFQSLSLRPGGVLEYAGGYLAQWDARPVLGAAIGASLIALTCWGGLILTRGLGWRHPAPLWLGGLALLVLEGQYDVPARRLELGAALAVWALVAWQACRRLDGWLRVALFWAIAAGLYLVAGAAPTLWFVAAGGVCEWAGHGGLGRPLFCWLAAGIVWAGTMLVEPATGGGQGWGGPVAKTALGLLALWLPALPLMAVRAVRSRRPQGPAVDRPAPAGLVAESSVGPRTGGWRAWIWGAGLAVAAVGLLLATVDVRRQRLVQIDQAAQAGQWNGVLEVARKLELPIPPATRLAIHMALFQTGRLKAELFAFPQQRGQDFFPSMREAPEVCGLLGDALLELGQVNLAEHFAHEALELAGDRPHLLWQLARINVLLDRPQAACVFLRRLRHVPFHREQAEVRLRALEADPTLAGEADIARVRLVRVREDRAESALPTEALLRQLLRSNPRNRLAYECWMGQCLLAARPEVLFPSLATLDELGYWETPRYLEEALAMGQSATAGGRQPSEDTLRRWREFQTALNQGGGATPDNRLRLAPRFGDTYWYFSVFGRSGSCRLASKQAGGA